MSVVRELPGPAGPARPRLYFVHVPKTGGITLKTFLELHYARGESLVIDKDEARTMPAGELASYRLFSGHYPAEVLHALDAPPDVLLTVVRDPIARFRSWAAHGRRLTGEAHRARFQGRSDADLLRQLPGAFQACHLARALRDGADSDRVPTAAELPELVDWIDLVGVTEHLERFMQLVAFRMGWPPPPLAWRINRRPDRDDDARDAEDRELGAGLAVDAELHALVSRRFWTAYADMLGRIGPERRVVAPDEAGSIDLDRVQSWLRRHDNGERTRAPGPPAAAIDCHADQPAAGEGWWWRESPGPEPYRWTGPAATATMSLDPLVEGRDYALEIELMGAADWTTWDGTRLVVNGHPVAALHERFGPFEPGRVSLRLHADVPAALVSAQRGATRLELTVPESRPVPGRAMVRESEDTFNRDERQVGVAVHRVRIVPASRR